MDMFRKFFAVLAEENILEAVRQSRTPVSIDELSALLPDTERIIVEDAVQRLVQSGHLHNDGGCYRPAV